MREEGIEWEVEDIVNHRTTQNGEWYHSQVEGYTLNINGCRTRRCGIVPTLFFNTTNARDWSPTGLASGAPAYAA